MPECSISSTVIGRRAVDGGADASATCGTSDPQACDRNSRFASTAPATAPPNVALLRVRLALAPREASFQSLILIFAATKPSHAPNVPPTAVRTRALLLAHVGRTWLIASWACAGTATHGETRMIATRTGPLTRMKCLIAENESRRPREANSLRGDERA